jgi:hypothetical protein
MVPVSSQSLPARVLPIFRLSASLSVARLTAFCSFPLSSSFDVSFATLDSTVASVSILQSSSKTTWWLSHCHRQLKPRPSCSRTAQFSPKRHCIDFHLSLPLRDICQGSLPRRKPNPTNPARLATAYSSTVVYRGSR